MLREMAANEVAVMNKERFRVNHETTGREDEFLSSRWLIKNGYDEKCTARIRGQNLPHKVRFGWLYWMRLDMHAVEQASAVGCQKPLNFHGLNPDAGKVSGQRFNLGMATVMHAKGLERVHEKIHRANVEKGAVRMTAELMEVLAYNSQKKPRRHHG